MTSLVSVIVPNVKDFKHYMSAYISEQSGRDLYQRLSRQTLVDISEKVQKRIGKMKRKQKETSKERVKDSEFFMNMMLSTAESTYDPESQCHYTLGKSR